MPERMDDEEEHWEFKGMVSAKEVPTSSVRGIS